MRVADCDFGFVPLHVSRFTFYIALGKPYTRNINGPE